MNLRPCQIEASHRILEELERVRSTLLVLAAGLGKTFTFAEVARVVVARGERVLVLAHRGELIQQAAATLRQFGLNVGVEQGEQRVDPQSLPEVVVASVQTLQGKRRQAFSPDAFGLIIVDECHHAVAKTYRGISGHFGRAKLLGVSATPDRADGVGLRVMFESLAYRMDLGAGIAGGWLAPLEVRSVSTEFDAERVRSVGGELVTADVEAELIRDGHLLAAAKALAELIDSRSTLVFVPGVATAHMLAGELRSHGVRALAVDGTMTVVQRSEALAAYRDGDVQVVVNAALLIEGFDAPHTSCVALLNPTRSRAKVIQMLGRGTRLAPGKESCLLLDFVPGRIGRVRLASPADALAGEELPLDIVARVRTASAMHAGNLETLIADAHSDKAAAEEAARDEAERARAERAAAVRKLVHRVGLPYAVAKLDVASLLEIVRTTDEGWRPEWRRALASPAQIAALRSRGVDVPDDLNKRDARALFDVLAQRSAAGLCTLRQARRLSSYGLRDDLSFEAAREAMDAIAANAWKPPPWMRSDPRFARGSAA